MSVNLNWNNFHTFLARTTHSFRQRTTDSQRNGRMAQKGCKCFDPFQARLLKAPCWTAPLMFVPPGSPGT